MAPPCTEASGPRAQVWPRPRAQRPAPLLLEDSQPLRAVSSALAAPTGTGGFQIAATCASQLWGPQVRAEGTGRSRVRREPESRVTTAAVSSHGGRGGAGALWSLCYQGDLITPKASPPNTVSLGARILHMNLGGHALQSVVESPSSGQSEAGAPGAGIRGAGGRGRSPAVGFAGSLGPCEAVRGGGQPPQEGKWPRGPPENWGSNRSPFPGGLVCPPESEPVFRHRPRR